MTNLIKTGQWYWRIDELSKKEFDLLSSEKKEKYVEFLTSIEKSQRSSNDIAILEQYKKYELIENFFSL